MFDSLKSLFISRRRCGVCLFKLDSRVRSLDLDVEKSPNSVFLEADYHEITRNDLCKSADRGCQICRRIASVFNTHQVEFSTARWWPGRYESPFLEVVEASLKYELRASTKGMAAFSENGIDLNSIQPCIVAGKKVGGRTSADKCLDQAASWLASCRQNHKSCHSDGLEFCPTRLLFLGGSNKETIRLAENLPKNTSYVALSHRWTEETLQIRLEHANLPKRRLNGISIIELPQMMRDVIFLLRRLGMLYLWIDCMCIIQDDQEDWRREAATMASVYTNAELTIAATWCDDNGQSLFCNRDGKDYDQVDIDRVDDTLVFLRPVLPHFTWKDLENDWFTGDSFVDPEREWPLLSRGWTYQEQLLSKRILHFTRHEIIWECNNIMECECGWYTTANLLEQNSMGLNKQSVAFKSWDQIIKEYSNRDLTFGTDKLPAVAGVAKAFGESHKGLGEYVCGLWEKQLEECFFWSVTESPEERPSSGRIPSWSWASVSGNITCWGVSVEDIEFLSVDVSYSGESFMGDVTGAKVTLSGQLTLATLFYERKDLDSSELPLTTAHNGTESFCCQVKIGDKVSAFRPDYRLDNPGAGFDGIRSGSSVFCLVFGRSTRTSFDPDQGVTCESVAACFLVLTAVDGSNNVFERIGLFEGTTYGEDDNCVDLETALSLSQRRELTLI